MAMNKTYINLRQRDLTLHVRFQTGANTELTPIVLLHGWPASSRGWERVVNEMSPERSIICPDLRGLGRSERKGDIEHFAKQEIARDIMELIDTLGHEEFYIGGQDWGGVAAQEIALQFPERAKSLIIMNINLINNLQGNLKGFQTQMASPLNPRWYMAFQSIPQLPEAMIPGSEDLWVRYFFERGSGKGAEIPQDLIAGYVDDYRREGTSHCGANYYRAMSLDSERWIKLAGEKFSQPSLLIYGDQDPFLVPEFYLDYEDCFADVERVDLPGGHFIQDERPIEVARKIESFINESEN